jgi:hypothetical protein
MGSDRDHANFSIRREGHPRSHRPGERTPHVVAEGPRALRERLTHSHAATAPRTIIARTTQSVGLGEKVTSAYEGRVSAGQPIVSMPQIGVSALSSFHFSGASPWSTAAPRFHFLGPCDYRDRTGGRWREDAAGWASKEKGNDGGLT